MKEKNDKFPQWLIITREKIKEAKGDWEGIRREGQADVRRGLEKERIANKRIEELGYIDHILGQDLPTRMWEDQVINITGGFLNTAANSVAQHSREAYTLVKGMGEIREEEQNTFFTLTDSTSAVSGTMCFFGAEMEKRMEAISSEYKPTFVYERTNIDEDGKDIYGELKNILENYDKKFVVMLDGSEDAIKTGGIDRLSHAAHSMRDLFEQILKFLAPSQVVEKQPWFQPTPGTPDGVSRRSRIKYLLYGSGTTYDEAAIKQMDEASGYAKDALDLVISRAHAHDPQLTEYEIKLVIHHSRFALYKILKQYLSRKR